MRFQLNCSKQEERQYWTRRQTCVAICETGEWTEEWTFSTFIALLKEGYLKQCANYRTIALVSHASKIHLRIIMRRIRVKNRNRNCRRTGGIPSRKGNKRPDHEYQNTDAQGREHQQPFYMCFVDFKKAFDSISHDKLCVTMINMGYPQHLIDWLGVCFYRRWFMCLSVCVSVCDHDN